MTQDLSRRWWIKTLLFNSLIALAVFGAIQLIPAGRSNPPVVREPDWDSPATRELAVGACFDCHSYETGWPWYGRIAPVSWMLWYDVTEGREDLNFSDWDQHDAPPPNPDEKFAPRSLSERIEDEIRSGRMPPTLYRLNHPAARLTDSEQDALIEGLIRTVEQSQRPPN